MAKNFTSQLGVYTCALMSRRFLPSLAFKSWGSLKRLWSTKPLSKSPRISSCRKGSMGRQPLFSEMLISWTGITQFTSNYILEMVGFLKIILYIESQSHQQLKSKYALLSSKGILAPRWTTVGPWPETGSLDFAMAVAAVTPGCTVNKGSTETVSVQATFVGPCFKKPVGIEIFSKILRYYFSKSVSSTHLPWWIKTAHKVRDGSLLPILRIHTLGPWSIFSI